MLDFNLFEAQMFEAADDDLAALPLARSATEALILALDGAEIAPPEGDPPPQYFVRSSVFLLSALALRTARACLLVVAAGYEPEAHGLKRKLSEIHARAQAITDDHTGQHARDWLDGKGPSTPRKVVGKWGHLGVWDVYSASEHADIRGLKLWLLHPMEDVAPGHEGLVIPPHRQPRFSNALLTEVAMECRDMAAALAVCRGGRIGGLEELDRLIEEAIEEHFEPPPADSAPDDAPIPEVND